MPPVIAIFPFILIVSIQILAGIALGQEQPAKCVNEHKTALRIFGGYNWYTMEDFNKNKLKVDIPISDETTWFYLRPISIGIYNLGALLNARFTVSDRPGRLDASGNTIGVSTGVNLRHRFL